MRFIVAGIDRESGQHMEMMLDAADVASAAAMADRKGVSAVSVVPANGAVRQAPPAFRPPIGQSGPAPESLYPASSPKPRRRLWLVLFLAVSGFLAPFFPHYTMGVGITLGVLVLAYLTLSPLRRGLGYFLRVSPERPTSRVVKLCGFAFTAALLTRLATAGAAMQKEAAVAAARAAAEAEGKAKAEAAANEQVIALVERAKAALNASDLVAAETALDQAAKTKAAKNLRLA